MRGEGFGFPPLILGGESRERVGVDSRITKGKGGTWVEERMGLGDNEPRSFHL